MKAGYDGRRKGSPRTQTLVTHRTASRRPTAGPIGASATTFGPAAPAVVSTQRHVQIDGAGAPSIGPRRISQSPGRTYRTADPRQRRLRDPRQNARSYQRSDRSCAVAEDARPPGQDADRRSGGAQTSDSAPQIRTRIRELQAVLCARSSVGHVTRRAAVTSQLRRRPVFGRPFQTPSRAWGLDGSETTVGSVRRLPSGPSRWLTVAEA